MDLDQLKALLAIVEGHTESMKTLVGLCKQMAERILALEEKTKHL